jgi:hypothetical protein
MVYANPSGLTTRVSRGTTFMNTYVKPALNSSSFPIILSGLVLATATAFGINYVIEKGQHARQQSIYELSQRPDLDSYYQVERDRILRSGIDALKPNQVESHLKDLELRILEAKKLQQK